MADVPKLGRESSLRLSTEFGIGGTNHASKMEAVDRGVSGKTAERCDSFVLEMDGLAPHIAAKDLTRSFPRKGSQRVDRKLQEGETDDSPSHKGGGNCAAAERAVAIPVGVDPQTTTEGCRYRRYGSRRPSWVNPKRVLLVFAAASSMGTIILIYFTLSMSKINGDDAVAALQ